MRDAFMVSAIEAMLEAYTAGLTTPKIGLYTNDITPSVNNVLADFVQPVGTWYAVVAAVFARAIILPDGTVEQHTQSVQFDYTGASTPETIRGWIIFHNTNVIVSARRLPTAVTLSGLTTSVRVNPKLEIPPIAAAA